MERKNIFQNTQNKENQWFEGEQTSFILSWSIHLSCEWKYLLATDAISLIDVMVSCFRTQMCQNEYDFISNTLDSSNSRLKISSVAGSTLDRNFCEFYLFKLFIYLKWTKWLGYANVPLNINASSCSYPAVTVSLQLIELLSSTAGNAIQTLHF